MCSLRLSFACPQALLYSSGYVLKLLPTWILNTWGIVLYIGFWIPHWCSYIIVQLSVLNAGVLLLVQLLMITGSCSPGYHWRRMEPGPCGWRSVLNRDRRTGHGRHSDWLSLKRVESLPRMSSSEEPWSPSLISHPVSPHRSKQAWLSAHDSETSK